MNVFDIIILLPISYGLVRGLFKGFVKEVVSFTSIIIALVVTEILKLPFANLLQSMMDISGKTAMIISYLFLFIATLIVVLLLSNIIHSILKAISLGGLNSLLGGFLGALKWAILISIVINVFDAIDSKFHFANEDKKEQSISYYQIQKLAPGLWEASKSDRKIES